MSNFKPHPIGRFPYWADAGSATETEAVGDKKKTIVPIPIPPYYYYSDQVETIDDHSSADPVSPDALDDSDVNLFPWEQWSQLPKVEREAEMKEAQKRAWMKEFEPWTDAKSVTETEAVGHHGGPNPVDLDPADPELAQSERSILKESGMDGLRESGMDGLRESGMDGLRESGMDGFRESDSQTTAADSLTGEADESTGNFTSTVRRFFSQSDSVTGDALAEEGEWLGNSPFFPDIHQDDGIQDGYLDVGADLSGFDSFLLQNGSNLIAPIAEPFADADAITNLVTGKSSPMEAVADPLVAAGPLDAVPVDEPRNNDF